jgi:hypothetical protein
MTMTELRSQATMTHGRTTLQWEMLRHRKQERWGRLVTTIILITISIIITDGSTCEEKWSSTGKDFTRRTAGNTANSRAVMLVWVGGGVSNGLEVVVLVVLLLVGFEKSKCACFIAVADL